MKKGVDFSTPKKSNFWGSLQDHGNIVFFYIKQIDEVFLFKEITNGIHIKMSGN